MNEVWFTSDTHFNHPNVIEYDNRPFFSIEGMTEAYVETWNSQVHRGDRVYHLGDFALSWGAKHAGSIDSILSRLNGQKHLIVGNHDRKEVVDNPRWTSVNQYHELKVDLGGVHKQRIVMSHYPFRSWNQMHRGSWMLHGHCHGNLPDPGGKIRDVGISIHERLLGLQEMRVWMATREAVSSGDHHEA